MPTPSPWLRTFTQAFTTGYVALVVPDGVMADLIVVSGDTPWAYAGDTAAAGFPVAADTPTALDFDAKSPIYIKAALAGTLNYAIFGTITAVLPGTDVLT